MNNFIDKKFYALIDDIRFKTEDEIYNHMVGKFITLPFFTQLSIQQFLNKFEYWGRIEVENMKFDMIKAKAKVFYHQIEDYIWLYKNLNDYKSKYILYSIINSFYNFDFQSLKYCMENVYKHYFDLDIMPKRKDDVFVDVGAYIGDSCLDYVSSYGEDSYKKIYCYEMAKENIEKMHKNLKNLKNIEIIEKAVSDKNGELFYNINQDSSANKCAENGRESVKSVRLDDDIQEKISMVKMDIEGGEKSAIKGMQNHIKTDILPYLYPFIITIQIY